MCQQQSHSEVPVNICAQMSLKYSLLSCSLPTREAQAPTQASLSTLSLVLQHLTQLSTKPATEILTNTPNSILKNL